MTTHTKKCSICPEQLTIMVLQKTPCNPPCQPRQMLGKSWYKLHGYNSECKCAELAHNNSLVDIPKPAKKIIIKKYPKLTLSFTKQDIEDMWGICLPHSKWVEFVASKQQQFESSMRDTMAESMEYYINDD